MTGEKVPLAPNARMGELLKSMDEAAEKAALDLLETRRLSDDNAKAVRLVAEWWVKWYMKAGHKRLGRILVKIAKEARQG